MQFFGVFLMQFEWDENKRQKVIEEHGVDFLYAALIFDGPVLTSIDNRRDYGEVRELSIGLVDDECFVVAHTSRKGMTRLITAWKGGRDERSIYEAGIARRNQGTERQG
jgi:uncharacterized protein